MSYEIKYSARAMGDLDNIIMYLSRFYPNTPKKFTAALLQCEENLRNNPFMFPVYLNNPLYRKAVVLKYIVFYAIHEGASIDIQPQNAAISTVEIYRILPGAIDLQSFI
jgi:plasmid stabilization system protein ParE